MQNQFSIENKRVQQNKSASNWKEPSKTLESKTCHQHVNQKSEVVADPAIIQKGLHTPLERKRIPELELHLIKELIIRDPWAAQVNRLTVSRLAQQLALNTWKEDLESGKVCLHLRASRRHLNLAAARSALCMALSIDLGTPVELTVIEDDNPTMKTPLEWYQVIYEEKLIKAKEAVINDPHIQMLQRSFDAELDEDSIIIWSV